jgi:hypothetical protein
VLREALQLLVDGDGPPLLRDSAVAAPATAGAAEGWACPLDLPPLEEVRETDRLAAAFESEMGRMRAWYDMALSQRGATTVGASGVAVAELSGFLCALLAGGTPRAPDADIPPERRVNLVADDIRAVYAEALTAQPGQQGLDGARLADWFYRETAAGRALYALRRLADDESVSEEVRRIAAGVAFPARLAASGQEAS